MKLIVQSILFLSAVVVSAGGSPADEERSLVDFFVAYETVRPGERLPVAVKITVADGWHTYAKEPGDSGMPPSIAFSGVDGLTNVDWRFPPPETFTDSVGTSYGYEHEVVLLSDVLIPETVPMGGTIELTASIQWMICRDVCVFLTDKLTVPLQSGAVSSEPSDEWKSLLKESGWETEITGKDVPGKEKP